MIVLVAFSGGKDSHASLIWAVKKYGAGKVVAVFCDTQWEHSLLYPFINEVCQKLGVRLVILRSEYSFIELALKKGRFPSTKAKFCTQKLKVEPMIDYVISQLEIHDYILVIQGIRKDESNARSKMEAHCQYFKYYFTPYGFDKDNKPKTFSYRKKDIIRLDGLAKVDIERPVFDKTAVEVIEDILQAGHKPNPLYYIGVGRVGCFPCIMVTHWEVWIMLEKEPDYAERLINAEREVKRSFFPPDYIPKRYSDMKDEAGNRWASAERVFEYIRRKNAQGELYPEESDSRNCMTAFNICE
jgi:3'-phosphoadenosine 5'-phosphosulfate sulfotransferase (PAPS reductase)/FAD synthetase